MKADRTHSLKQGARKQWLALLILLAFVTIAVLVWTAPQRRERALSHEPLRQLLLESQHDQNNPRLFYYLTLRAQQAGQNDLAMKAYFHAAELSPDDEGLWLAWAGLAASMQRNQSAHSILRTFLLQHPKSVSGHLMQARLFQQSGDHQHAFLEADTAAKLEPSHAQAWEIMSAEALANHDFSNAEPAFRRSITLDPQNWLNYAGLGDTLYSMKRYEEAAAVQREAVRLAPNLAVTHLTLGESLLRMAVSPAQMAEARHFLTQALSLRGNLMPRGLFVLYMSLGQCSEQEQHWTEALSWLKQAAPLEPADPFSGADAHFELSRVYQALGNSALADRELHLHEQRVAFMTQVLALSGRFTVAPNHSEAALALARLYRAHGYDDEAKSTYRSLLLNVPDDITARRELKTLENKHGRIVP